MPTFLVTVLRSGPQWDPSRQPDWPARVAFISVEPWTLELDARSR